MTIAAPMATADIPTVNGSVIMIISRLASGLAPATVTPNMDWIITAKIRTAHTPAVSRPFFARWSSTWRHLHQSDWLIARRLYSSATRAARPAQPTVVFHNGDGWFLYNLACNLAAQ